MGNVCTGNKSDKTGINEMQKARKKNIKELT